MIAEFSNDIRLRQLCMLEQIWSSLDTLNSKKVKSMQLFTTKYACLMCTGEISFLKMKTSIFAPLRFECFGFQIYHIYIYKLCYLPGVEI